MKLKCHYCKEVNAKKLIILDGRLVYQCKKCLLIQTKINIEVLKKINIDKYNNEYLNGYEKQRSKQLVKFYLQCIQDIEMLKKGKYLLDVGCGPGLFLKVISKFSKYAWNTIGIDINEQSLKRVDKEFQNKVFNRSIENNNFYNQSFDVVTCFDSFEHFYDIKKSLNQICRILKNDGLLVMQVPNYNSTMRKLCGEDWDWWCIPDHVYHFQYETLNSILLNSGFKIIKVKTWEPSEIFIKNIQGHIKKTFPTVLQYNKIVAKLAIIPLLIICVIHNIIECKKGGLLYLIAQKQ